MSDALALVTALILERPLCMPCITETSGLTFERASAALEVIERALRVHRALDRRCHACGVSGVLAYGALLQLLAAASLEIERLQAKVMELSHPRRTA